MRWSALLVLAIGCAGPNLSVRPDLRSPECGDAYVGVPRYTHLTWRCEYGQHGSETWRDTGKCQHALEATARCEGIACAIDVLDGPRGPAPDRRSINEGRRMIEVVPQEPGDMTVLVDLVHAGGLRETVAAPVCAVSSRPLLTIGCQTRDPATGAYSPCPASVPAGAELHVEVTAFAERGTPPAASIFNGDREVSLTYPAPDLECRGQSSDDRHVTTIRCTWRPAAGHHVLRGLFERFKTFFPEQRLEIDVR